MGRISSRMPGGKVATIGISAFALEALTDLVYIELPKVGRRSRPAKPFGEIESVKAVSDLYSPVDGEVVAVQRATWPTIWRRCTPILRQGLDRQNRLSRRSRTEAAAGLRGLSKAVCRRGTLDAERRTEPASAD